ncbi:MAG: hypothetical protein AAF442_03880 [Pseudomonadota bacterium]
MRDPSTRILTYTAHVQAWRIVHTDRQIGVIVAAVLFGQALVAAVFLPSATGAVLIGGLIAFIAGLIAWWLVRRSLRQGLATIDQQTTARSLQTLVACEQEITACEAKVEAQPWLS